MLGFCSLTYNQFLPRVKDQGKGNLEKQTICRDWRVDGVTLLEGGINGKTTFGPWIAKIIAVAKFLTWGFRTPKIQLCWFSMLVSFVVLWVLFYAFWSILRKRSLGFIRLLEGFMIPKGKKKNKKNKHLGTPITWVKAKRLVSIRACPLE